MGNESLPTMGNLFCWKWGVQNEARQGPCYQEFNLFLKVDRNIITRYNKLYSKILYRMFWRPRRVQLTLGVLEDLLRKTLCSGLEWGVRKSVLRGRVWREKCVWKGLSRPFQPGWEMSTPSEIPSSSLTYLLSRAISWSRIVNWRLLYLSLQSSGSVVNRKCIRKKNHRPPMLHHFIFWVSTFGSIEYSMRSVVYTWGHSTVSELCDWGAGGVESWRTSV